jgi:hypothetical protein
MLRRSFVALRVVIPKRRLEGHAIFKTDQPPTDAIAIPAIAWIAEESVECVRSEQLEEVGLLDRVDQTDLLLARKLGDTGRARKHFLALLLHLRHASSISLAQTGIERRKRAIDEIDDAGFVRARAIGGRYDLRRDRVKFRGHRRIQRLKGRRSRRLHGVMRELLSRGDIR